MKEIQYILFDCGNVLQSYDWDVFFDKLVRFTDLSVEQIRKFFKNDLRPYYQDFTSGKIGSEEFFGTLANGIKARKDLTFEKFEQGWDGIFFKENDEMRAIIEKLKPGIGIKILSNTNPLHWALMEGISVIKRYFKPENQLLSYKIGFRKPEKEIFIEAMKQCGCEAGNILFIDDRLENVEAFRALGGNAIQYNCRTDSIDKLEKEMNKFGVLQQV